MSDDTVSGDGEGGADWADIEAQALDDLRADEEETRRKVDRIRVLGYALACARAVKTAHESMERAATALARARTRAENAQAKLIAELEAAEAMAKVATANNPEWTAEVARCLEECFG